MTPRIALALLTVSLLMQSPVGRAENADPAGAPLGRLFLTPEFRTALERQRQLNIQQSRTLEGETLRLDGVVVRSSGKSTVWINSQPQTESTRDSGVAASVTLAGEKLAAAAQSLQNLTEDQSPTVQHLNTAAQEISRAARSLRQLAETLEQQPEALLRGKETGEE